MVPKFKNLQFELEEKLGHHTVVKFNGQSTSDSLDALKRCFNPKWPIKLTKWSQKIENLKFEPGEKLGHHTVVKFNGKIE